MNHDTFLILANLNIVFGVGTSNIYFFIVGVVFMVMFFGKAVSESRTEKRNLRHFRKIKKKYKV